MVRIDAWRQEPTSPFAVGAALIAVGSAQIADLLTFVQMVGLVGLHAELNPLVAHAADVAGLHVLAAAKIALVVLVVAVFGIVARVDRRVAGFVATAGTAAGLVGALSNVLAVLA